MTRLLCRVLFTVAAITTLTVTVWLAVVMLRTPRDCGWRGGEHP